MRIERFLYSSIPLAIRISLEENLKDAFECVDYCESFPLVFGPNAIAEHFLIREGDEVCASLAVLRLTYQRNDTLGQLPCIGSVCVKKSKQGRGLAKLLLQQLLNQLASEGLTEACLFASDDRVYRSLGFRYAQPDYLFDLTQIKPNQLSLVSPGDEISNLPLEYTFEFREGASLSEDEMKSLWLLHCRANAHVTTGAQSGPHFVISCREFSLFLSETPISVLVLNCAEHSFGVAAMLFGKGADFPNTWHSLAIEPSQPISTQVRLGRIMVAKAGELRPGSQLHMENKDHVLFNWISGTFEHNLSPNFMISRFPEKSFHQNKGVLDLDSFVVPSFLSI
jgi:predicted N-acetyltransferase YhbS